MKLDGQDITGGVMERGGFAALLAYPSMKEPVSQEWAEYDGVEVDLSNPKLERRDVTLPFSFDSVEDMDAFIYKLTTEGYKTVEQFGVERRLRYLSQGDIEMYANCVRFSVTMSDDFPRALITRDSYNPQGHGLPVPPTNKYYVDGINLSSYGLFVLKGKASLYQSPEMKPALTITNAVMDGVVYDTGLTRFRPKEESFRMAFYTDTIDRLLYNYEAFFHALIQPNERSLETDYLIEALPFYYRSASNFEFTKTSSYCLLEFDLSLVFTNYRPSDLEVLLATELWDLIITEDGLDFIDMKRYGS